MNRVKIVTVTEDYIHAEFSSRIFRFVDDVEFLFDDQNKRVHLRSASRVGYSDLGVNRKRIERIRAKFIDSGQKQHQMDKDHAGLQIGISAYEREYMFQATRRCL